MSRGFGNVTAVSRKHNKLYKNLQRIWQDFFEMAVEKSVDFQYNTNKYGNKKGFYIKEAVPP